MANGSSHVIRTSVGRFTILRNVLVFAVFLTAAVYALILKGDFPSPDPLKMEAGISERFWQLKVRGCSEAQLVILGDSRVNTGVSPAILTDQLPGEGWRGLNLAFQWGGLNPEIYDFAETRLDVSSPLPPVILLGVSPGTLTLERRANQQFHSLLQTSWLMAQAYIFFPRLAGMLSRGEVSPEIKQHPGKTDYHDSGWQFAIRNEDRRPDAWLEVYRDVDRISRELRADCMNRVHRWTEKGIHVFAFRPPTSPALRKIENSATGFDESRFTEDFEASGGHWIEVDASRFQTFDNSHLSGDQAVRLSRELGRQIAANLGATGKTSPAESR